MTDERTNGSLRACEADATCHAPAVRRVNVLRPGWKVAEPRLYCFEHAAQVEAAAPPIATPKPLDHPVRRPLRAEVLAALRSEPRHLSVIRKALTRPALPMTVRRELDALIEEGLAVEGPPSHFARQEATVKPGKTAAPPLTQHERVIEDVRAHPWTSVGDIMRRTEDGAASARLTQAVQAGEIVRIGEKRSYRYAMPGTPIPGLVEVAPVEVEESPEWGVADAPEEAFGRPMTLAERLARATGVDLTRGDVGLVEAVEAAVAERDALRVVWESVTTSVGMGGHKPEAIARDVERQIREKYSLARQLFAAQDLLVEALEDYQGQVADGVRALVAQRDASRAEVEGYRQAQEATHRTLDEIRVAVKMDIGGVGLVDEVKRTRAALDDCLPRATAYGALRNALWRGLGLSEDATDEGLLTAVHQATIRVGWWDALRTALEQVLEVEPGALDDGELVEAVADRRRMVAREVAEQVDRERPVILATANASLREIGGGIAKRCVGCTVALGSGSAFFPLSDEAARTLAPLLFRGVTVALLALVPSRPTPVVPEFPSAPTPDDDADLFAF